MIKTLPVVCLAIAPLLLHSPNTVAMPAAPQLAQSSTTYRTSTADLVKARNLARQTIETRNGGIRRYRAEKSMHGPVSGAPVTENDDDTLTFNFRGGTPARTPTIESVVTVNPSDWSVRVDYNGAIRR